MNIVLFNLLCSAATQPRTSLSSIAHVAKMLPESIKATIPFNYKDPWWLIRDVISPIGVAVVPQGGFIIILDKVITSAPALSNTNLFVITVVIGFGYMLMIQIQFLARYFIWAEEERNYIK
jgi:hypothetical protein